MARPEILAPAGTWETLWAAVEHGADAVYLGLKRFNARALASNFTLEEVAWVADELHARGRRLFVAFNSLLKERELEEAAYCLAALEEIGADGVILQDLGLWRMAKRHFPGLRLHASTLMAIHNLLGVRQAERMGFRRVVLAREMTLDEIRAVAAGSEIELEVFVHGAMCFTVSGRCLFSSMFGGMASTRGRCVQPCRRRYTWGGETGYFFSMADLCGLDAVGELARAGVCSFKIEGRLRPAHYVASVVRAYRMVIDSGYDDPAVMEEARAIVAASLGRRLSSGFFFSRNGEGVIAPSLPGNTGEYVGKVVQGDGRKVVAEAVKPVQTGDRLRVVSRHGAQWKAECIGGGSAARCVELELEGGAGSVVGCQVFRFNKSSSGLVDKAWKGRRGARPIPGMGKRASERVREILGDGHGGCGGSVGRRSAPKLFLRVRSLDRSVLEADGILVELTRENLKRASKLGRDKRKVIWFLPPVTWQEKLDGLVKVVEAALAKGFNAFQVSNVGHLSLFAEQRRPAIYSSYHLNLLNSQAVKAVQELGVKWPEISLEVDGQDVSDLSCLMPKTGMTVYGYIPLFTARALHRAYSGSREVVSPKGERFRWVRRGDVGHLLHSSPISLARKLRKLRAVPAYWVVDLLFGVSGKKRRWRAPKTVEEAERLRGRSGNLGGKLR